ncbi:hypothetical protein F4824DRAFT_495508 [Ustulina deusta]|nr:hypothetical protein F4824DRAFT_495508 [Ustulina deusta]
MARIYAKATIVSCWLGEASVDSPRAISWLRLFYRGDHASGTDNTKKKLFKCTNPSQDDLHSTSFPALTAGVKAKSTKDRFFFFTNSRHGGKAPVEINDGDKVAVLLGRSVLVVLWPKGIEFQVVGGARTYGLMQGQIFDTVDAWDGKD